LSESDKSETPHKVEMLISYLLRAGVICSLTIVVVGTALSFAHHRDYLSSHSALSEITAQKAVFPHDLLEIRQGIAHLSGRAVAMAGLLLLIATPVLRVAVSIMVFVIEKDAAFVVFTALVLTLLILSFFFGNAGG
jgi:uncharacterized membrane protein